eukprot:gene33004-42700_t
MAPYCKNYDDIEAFTEVLRTLIEGIDLIKTLQNPQLSEERLYFSFTSHLLASYNLESIICMDEPVKIITAGIENLKAVDTFESKCEIEEVSSRERIATENLKLLHSLIMNQEFKFVENVFLDFNPSTGDPSFTIFVNNQKLAVTEVNIVIPLNCRWLYHTGAFFLAANGVDRFTAGGQVGIELVAEAKEEPPPQDS